MFDLAVPVASYVIEEMRSLADTLGVSVDALACYFFAKEVVYT